MGRGPMIPGLRLMVALAAGLWGVVVFAALTRPAINSAEWAERERAFDPATLLNINRANVPELTLLPGIGDQLATRIVADRERVGAFADIDDLQRVHGIGPLTVKRISRYIRAGVPG